MIIIKGYCLKYGPTKASHAPIAAVRSTTNVYSVNINTSTPNIDTNGFQTLVTPENGACMHGLACITGIPVYIKDYEEVFNSGYLPDGTADLFHRKDGIYCTIRLPDMYSDMVDALKEYKIGCYANGVKKNEVGNIVDGKIRYVNLCKSNIEEIEVVISEKPFEEPIILYENKED